MATIEAKRRLNRTPFRLEKGKRYRFSASGTWKDWTRECSATGYTAEKLRRWEGWRRERNGKWFSVIGCIGKMRGTQFDIGHLIETNSVYTASATGVLYCFANDVWFMYWNNEGSIDLQFEPLEGKQAELPSNQSLERTSGL